jgi:hypothetical protein
VLLDPVFVLRDYLADLKRRLNELGFRRIRTGGGYYWMVKPDLKPGEDFSL